MSLFNYITFAETTTTKVEKQFIQQQQEHEHEQALGQQQQLQIQSEQTVHRKTKTKKHKKHTEIIQQQQEQQIQQSIEEITSYEQRETFAEESNTEAPTIETLEQIEELLPYSTNLSTQNVPKNTHETIPVSVTTELSTPKPIAAQVHDELLPQKTLAVNEECLAFDEVSSSLAPTSPATSELIEQVEVHERHAASIIETQTKETHKELKSSKIPKLIQAERKIKESRPLLIEAPSIEDSIVDLESAKAPIQQAHGEILYSHELTSQQQSILDSVESLKTPAANTEKAQSQLLENESILITESFRGETVDKETSPIKPSSEQISPKFTPSVSLGISECQPEDSVAELSSSKEVRAETTSITVEEFKAFSTSESRALECEENMSAVCQPTKSMAELSIKPEEAQPVVQQVDIMESITDEKPAPQHIKESQALKQLVLMESLINTTADARSPIEESLPVFQTDAHVADSSLETQSHVITEQTVFNEDGPRELALEKIPKNIAATLSQTSSLTIGESQETQLIETTEKLVKPTVEPAKPAKESFTTAFGAAIGNQEAIYDTAEFIEHSATELNQGKLNITEAELVAEVHAQTIIDSEQKLLPDLPETGKAKLNFIEQKALDIKQDTGIEKETSLVPKKPLDEQAAVEKMIPAELKASSVWEVQPHVMPADIASDSCKPASASPVFETKTVGVTLEHESLKGTDYLETQRQPELRSGQLLMSENQQSLEVTAVQVIESSGIIESVPQQPQLKAEEKTDTLTHTQYDEQIILESTMDYASEGKPTAALADITMPAQIGADVREQALLESLQPQQEVVQPQQQMSATTFDLLQPLETSSHLTLEQEMVLRPDEQNIVQNASIGTLSALQVANKSRPQHMESVQDLGEKTQPTQQQAEVNIGEVSLPECEEVTPFDAIKDYLAPSLNKSAITNVQIIENTTALDTTTAITHEKADDIEEPIVIQQSALTPKLNESTKKSPILEQPNVFDHIAELHDFNPTLVTTQPTLSSFDEIHVQETKTFEKEITLEEDSKPIKQLAKVSLDSTTGIVVSQQENTFELERDLELPTTSMEQAKCIASELLKLPLTEGVQDNQSTGDLAEFKVSNKFAISSIDALTESTTSEAIIYDNVLLTEVRDQPECVSSQSIIPHEHKLITECVVVSEVEEYERIQAKESSAKPIQDTFSQLAVKENQNTLEAESELKTKRSEEFNAKVSDVLSPLYTKGVDEIKLYETVAQTKPTDKVSEQEAGISHVMSHVPITNLQQIIESTDKLFAEGQTCSIATSSDNASQLKVPVNTSIQTVEDTNEFIPSTYIESTAQPILEGHHYEVTVTDSQYVEGTEALSPTDEVLRKATESLNAIFKATSQLEEVNVFQKECIIQPTESREITAKSSLIDILQHTTTTDAIPYEQPQDIKQAESNTQNLQEPQLVSTDANKLTVQLDDLILQREDTFLDTQPTGYGKPFIEGTQREMLISEVIPIENIDNLALPTIKTEELSTNVTCQTEIHKTVSTVAIYEKANDLKSEHPIERHGAEHTGSDIKCAQVTTMQTSFIKEDNMAPLNIVKNVAQATSTERVPLITEEVISVSSIQESYDLNVPTEVNADLKCEMGNQATTITEQFIYEESPNIELEQSEQLTSKINLVESSTNPVQTSTVSVYENIEGHGVFKPQSAQPKSDILTDLKVSVVEEVTVVSSIDSLPKEEPTLATATSDNIPHRKVLETRQEPCENVQNLVDESTPMVCASYTLADTKVAAVSSEPHVKETIAETSSSTVDLEHAKPSIIPFSSQCLSEQIVTEEQVTTLHKKNETLHTNANISFEAINKNQAGILNLELIENVQPTIEDKESALQRTLVVSNNINVHLPKDAKLLEKDKPQTDLELKSDSNIQYLPPLSSNVTKHMVKSHTGKYIIRLILRLSTAKGVLLPQLFDPQATKHILHKTILKIHAELRLKANFSHRYKSSHRHKTHTTKDTNTNK